ncbi:uncharacterized protein TRIADDRAFT_53467 [Trichoplax adhaerens]|uniref:Uncharacterized protein n=1 Tax=Trichoplax adhaerens TaxID=10228 RepID=B3RPA8_TRIAD|nr:predicted protein [Trichoplax adhaerens]EDV27604.1 predicted protein [Trichoplax adhaerens]|eukprot:XP_002109438.1 predicted protein [Trichoplax adhaerens]
MDEWEEKIIQEIENANNQLDEEISQKIMDLQKQDGNPAQLRIAIEKLEFQQSDLSMVREWIRNLVNESTYESLRLSILLNEANHISKAIGETAIFDRLDNVVDGKETNMRKSNYTDELNTGRVGVYKIGSEEAETTNKERILIPKSESDQSDFIKLSEKLLNDMTIKKSSSLPIRDSTKDLADIAMTDLSKVLANVEPESKLIGKDETEIDTTEIVLENPIIDPLGLDTESMTIDLTNEEQRKSLTDSLFQNSNKINNSLYGSSGDKLESLFHNVSGDVNSPSSKETLDSTEINDHDSELTFNSISLTGSKRSSVASQVEIHPSSKRSSVASQVEIYPDSKHSSVASQIDIHSTLQSNYLSKETQQDNPNTTGDINDRNHYSKSEESTKAVDNRTIPNASPVIAMSHDNYTSSSGEDDRSSSLRQRPVVKKEDLKLLEIVAKNSIQTGKGSKGIYPVRRGRKAEVASLEREILSAPSSPKLENRKSFNSATTIVKLCHDHIQKAISFLEAGVQACYVPLPQKVLHECQMLSAFGALLLRYYNKERVGSSVNLNHCCLQLTVSMEMLAEHVRTWGSMDIAHNTYDHINIQLLGITKIAGGNVANMLLAAETWKVSEIHNSYKRIYDCVHSIAELSGEHTFVSASYLFNDEKIDNSDMIDDIDSHRNLIQLDNYLKKRYIDGSNRPIEKAIIEAYDCILECDEKLSITGHSHRVQISVEVINCLLDITQDVKILLKDQGLLQSIENDIDDFNQVYCQSSFIQSVYNRAVVVINDVERLKLDVQSLIATCCDKNSLKNRLKTYEESVQYSKSIIQDISKLLRVINRHSKRSSLIPNTPEDGSVRTPDLSLFDHSKSQDDDTDTGIIDLAQKIIQTCNTLNKILSNRSSGSTTPRPSIRGALVKGDEQVTSSTPPPIYVRSTSFTNKGIKKGIFDDAKSRELEQVLASVKKKHKNQVVACPELVGNFMMLTLKDNFLRSSDS